ncbi:MAG: DinB family protein [Longimicrobiales bacterium]
MTTMSGAMMIPEFDQEFAQTRIALERIPEDKFDWKPHDKSFSLKGLGAHLSDICYWMAPTLDMDLMDLDANPWNPPVPDTKEGILARFDAGVKEARAKLEAATPEKLQEMWSMKWGGEVAMTMPKGAVVRSFIMNHNIHHRAQLGVYLRLLGVAVPGHYGPSADEAM